ncbi:MAG: peptidylprolyl isomerase [Pseudomonadota bacterium]|nr:peptidylprolyl isomerase [Pseudomonadota bacterium]
MGPGKQVTLHFSLALADAAKGSEAIDSNFDKEPVSFTIGDGNLLPGFEEALFGLGAGDRREFVLPPEQAFGNVNEDNVQRFPVYQFPPDVALSPGLMLEFGDAAGNNQAGVVRSVDKQYVDVDFNHPLAGRAIRFSVHVHAVSPVASLDVSQVNT